MVILNHKLYKDIHSVDITAWFVFWAFACLLCRAVFLVDFSWKRSLDLRLLLGVANGETWFTCWGYCLARCCFSVSTPTYAAALEAWLPSMLIISAADMSIVWSPSTAASPPNLWSLSASSLRCLLDWKHHEPPLSPGPAKPCIHTNYHIIYMHDSTDQN